MTADSGALLGIHHAALICSDYARSKDFYVRILGLRVLAENHRAARAIPGSWTWPCPTAASWNCSPSPRRRPVPAARKPRACATSRSG